MFTFLNIREIQEEKKKENRRKKRKKKEGKKETCNYASKKERTKERNGRSDRWTDR
jgi:hypothetical protein